MSDTPKVSIIMPVFNRGELIGRSVRSVLRQTRPDFELIVVDDASTDGAPERVEAFGDPRIRVIRRPVNHLRAFRETGRPDNPRNDGLAAARGEYIAYLDSDDIYRSDFLAVMTDALDRHPDVGLAYCDAVWHRQLPGEEETAACNLSIEFGTMVMRHRNIMRTPTVMHRRSLVAAAGLFWPIKVRVPRPGAPYVGIEDWDYWLRLSRLTRVRHVNRALVHKINETSIHYPDPDYDPEYAGHLLELDAETRSVRRFAELSALLRDVDGFLEPAVGYALNRLAVNPGVPGAILEIGSFLGLSTCWLALGAREGGRGPVTAVDHFLGSPEHQKGRKHVCKVLVKEGTTWNRFRENLTHRGLWDQVRPIRSGSLEAARDWREPIALLFLDGDHAYEATAADFAAWSPHVAPGGLLAFHDVGGWPGVTRFYEEMLAAGNCRQVMAVDSLRVVQKPYS